MFMEPRARIEQRQRAARRWLDDFAEKCRTGDQPRGSAERALMVFVLTHETSDFLAEHDPQGLKQAQEVLTPGHSWADYRD